MPFEVYCVDFFTFVLLTFGMCKSTINIMKKNNTIYFILIVFYILFVLPIGIDILITFPSYSTWNVFRNFEISYNDPLTRVIYDIWTIISFMIMYMVGLNFKINSKWNVLKPVCKNDSCINKGINNKWILTIFFTLGIMPIIIVLIFKLPTDILYTMFWLDNGLYEFTGRTQVIYYTLQRATFFCIPCCFMYFVNAPKKNKVRKLIMLISIYSLICLESKRAILAVVGVMIISYLIYNTKFKNRKYVMSLGLTILIVLLIFSLGYMVEHRVYNIDYSFINTYTQIKMDFMRDDRVKAVIYSILNPSKMNILDYPFQSYITQISSIFPLEFLFANKLIGYNTYFTCAMLELPISTGLNWMTTSFFDEMIANFNVIGMFLGPYIIGKICLISDKYSSKLKVISIIGILLLMMLSLNYIMWYVQIWFLILILERYKIVIHK